MKRIPWHHYSVNAITRKVSQIKTAECPIYNPYEGIWMESDAQLRERITKIHIPTREEAKQALAERKSQISKILKWLKRSK